MLVQILDLSKIKDSLELDPVDYEYPYPDPYQ